MRHRLTCTWTLRIHTLPVDAIMYREGFTYATSGENPHIVKARQMCRFSSAMWVISLRPEVGTLIMLSMF